MKLRIFAVLALLATMFCTIGAVAQSPGSTWANTQVTLRTETVNTNTFNFYLNTHSIGQEICINFTVDPTSYNVTGDFVGRYTVHTSSGSNDIYMGRYVPQNVYQPSHVYITFSWTAGACN